MAPMRPGTMALLAVVGLEVGAAMLRHRRRSVVFDQAQARATALGRPLIVIGDPDAGVHTALVRAYGCGDVCIDLHEAPGCPNALALDLDVQPLPFADDSVVVYVSCTLEYLQHPVAAWGECLRVAGGPQNAFCVTVDPWCMTALFYPGARWTVDRAGHDVVGFTPVAARPLLEFVTFAGRL